MIRSSQRLALSLIELLIVMSILGVLIALALPAIQRSREASRRSSCQNQLRNQAVAVLGFHEANRIFPAGLYAVGQVDHAWCSYVLPFLEESPLYRTIDFSQRWNAPDNMGPAWQSLHVYECPTSTTVHAGKADYAGIMGTSWSRKLRFSQAFRSGVLIRIGSESEPRIRLKHVSDGTSKTLLIAESAERTAAEHGLWADGLQIVSHNTGPINAAKGEIYSKHPGGAYGAFVDGHVAFLADSTDPRVIGAQCTRAAGEVDLQDN